MCYLWNSILKQNNFGRVCHVLIEALIHKLNLTCKILQEKPCGFWLPHSFSACLLSSGLCPMGCGVICSVKHYRNYDCLHVWEPPLGRLLGEFMIICFWNVTSICFSCEMFVNSVTKMDSFLKAWFRNRIGVECGIEPLDHPSLAENKG